MSRKIIRKQLYALTALDQPDFAEYTVSMTKNGRKIGREIQYVSEKNGERRITSYAMYDSSSEMKYQYTYYAGVRRYVSSADTHSHFGYYTSPPLTYSFQTKGLFVLIKRDVDTITVQNCIIRSVAKELSFFDKIAPFAIRNGNIPLGEKIVYDIGKCESIAEVLTKKRIISKELFFKNKKNRRLMEIEMGGMDENARLLFLLKTGGSVYLPIDIAEQLTAYFKLHKLDTSL